eukprot:scaffold98367_cov21-Tisochrysis_lutea.AAC.4
MSTVMLLVAALFGAGQRGSGLPKSASECVQKISCMTIPEHIMERAMCMTIPGVWCMTIPGHVGARMAVAWVLQWTAMMAPSQTLSRTACACKMLHSMCLQGAAQHAPCRQSDAGPSIEAGWEPSVPGFLMQPAAYILAGHHV